MLTDSYHLFIQALHVINAAITAHQDSAWLKRQLRTWRDRFEGEKMGVAIFNGNPNLAEDYFTIALKDDGFVLVDHAPCNPITWKVTEDFLKDVATRPQYYIENPDRLDWDWMQNGVPEHV